MNTIQKSGDDYWLVGGCLRNAFLDIPQIDIDIATAVDPTALAQNWATTVGGKWFWLDVNRKQSRVILRHGLTVDFAPLRAPSIIADLQLRDFTVNALALLLDDSFLEADIIDPLGGINHLQNRKLITCSTQSFNADPLRMLKGIRHAVSLNFTLAVATQEQIKESAHLLIASAGERIRTELAKIFTAQNVGRGISLLLDTGIWDVIAGSTGSSWDKTTTIDGIENLRNKILEKGLVVPANQTDSVSPDQFSLPAIFLFARLFKLYCP
ncbi:MAG: CCA tRNA nucleotidyltransferase, partial [Desulfuromonadales bacterium]|nr:CCA tRNA nucleotidyltransferase [Desulfuromonadales bacterium]